MFDAMIMVCIVHKLGGDLANQCYGKPSEQVFKTYNSCREWADEEEINISGNGLKETGKLFVTQIACGEYKN